MTLDVRGTPESIDEHWLTATLGAAGVAGGATVTGVQFRGEIGTGQTGRNARFALTWDDPTDRPASVVAKFPSADPAARAAAFANGTYIKEWFFYHDLVDTVSIRTPAIYAAHFDPEAPDFVLLMEDVSGSVQGDQIAGLSVDEAALAAEEAVGLHAPHWANPTLAAKLGVDLSDEEKVAAVNMMYGATMGGFLDRLGHRLDADVVELVQRFAGSVGQWALGTGSPTTLVHMDYRPDNFLFARDPGAPPIVVVDWQTVNVGLATSDIAYLLGGCFDPDVRASAERELVESYRRRLVATGIDYDADTCWRDYRFSSLWGVAMTVIATVLAEKTERGDDMLTAMAQRHGRHALDLDALALLE
ncbi:MAG: phosphotransferase [Acidimicrobiales bacterium]